MRHLNHRYTNLPNRQLQTPCAPFRTVRQRRPTKLAAMMIDGTGTARDYAQALELCKSAAKDRYAPGLFCIGYLSEHGLGVPPDLKEAAKWYREASPFGHIKATLRLAAMNAKGEGTSVDHAEAYLLYFLA